MTQLLCPKAIVTGATGFIGSRLVAALERHGYRIAAMTRGDVSSAGGAAVDWYSLDEPGNAAFDDASVLFHLAGRAHIIREHAANPEAEFRAANVDLTIRMAEWAADSGVRRFVFLSSIAALGSKTAPGSHFSELTIPAPETDYGKSKLMAEVALTSLGQATGMEIVIVRPPMVYGPGAKGNFARMMALLKLGMPLPFGATDNRRSFVGVGNLTDFLIRCAEHPHAAGQTFLVSDDQDISTTDFLRMSAEALGLRPFLIPVPKRFLQYAAKVAHKEALIDKLVGDLRIDCSRAKSVLSWQPSLSIRDGLRSTTS
ncbi:NAD-dependent epimerase/dehydratase family protein [Devosia sp. XGJD_8]|uniref:NAD-dependent epimerase/dehydratase family protein n=1 Tax=Devosia sp. XGJD_8 TaxID=3391187 RepID=UPI0039852C2A